MSGPRDSLQLSVTVDEAEADANRLEQLALSLRGELLGTDAQSVDRLRAGPAPAGTRGLDAATIGTLLVGVTSSTWAITQVVDTVRGWVGRASRDCAVQISVGDQTLRLAGAATEQQRQLVTEFLRSVAPATPAEE